MQRLPPLQSTSTPFFKKLLAAQAPRAFFASGGANSGAKTLGAKRQGMLSVEELGHRVEKGEIETVVVAFTDLIGRQFGKRWVHISIPETCPLRLNAKSKHYLKVWCRVRCETCRWLRVACVWLFADHRCWHEPLRRVQGGQLVCGCSPPLPPKKRTLECFLSFLIFYVIL